jgi:hypothetical protein
MDNPNRSEGQSFAKTPCRGGYIFEELNDLFSCKNLETLAHSEKIFHNK